MTLIIAEAGVNHNGNEQLAFQLVDAAYAAGADIVKFQTFKAKNLVTAQALQADYQVTNTGKQESQLAMLSRLELSYDAHHQLVAYCNKLGIEFLSTAFDSESLDFLVNDLGLTRLKIPSGEITNAPLVLQHARTGCDLIVSTGMATLADIEAVLGVIAFGYTASADTQPSVEAFQAAYFSAEGKAALKQKVTVLHCTTEYPAPLADINLRAMDTIAAAFGLAIGYSDHSEGIWVPVAAVGNGIDFIVTGHTHLERAIDMGSGRYYFNCGTWIRLLSFTPEMLKDQAAFQPVYKILIDGKMESIDNASFGGQPFVMNQTSAVSIKKTASGKYILDMGQNFAGWIKLQNIQSQFYL